MPDVFDTLEAPAKADVFDEISVNQRPLAGRLADVASKVIGDPSGFGVAGWTQALSEFDPENLAKRAMSLGLGKNADLSAPTLTADITPLTKNSIIGGTGIEQGLNDFVKSLVEGGSSPEGVAKMAALPKMMAEMAASSPEDAAEFGDALGRKDTAGATKALLNYVAKVAPVAGFVHGAMKPPELPGPPLTGRQIPMPEGARPPAAPPAAVKAVKEGVDAGLPLSAEAASKRKEVAPVISETVPTGVNKSAATIVEPPPVGAKNAPTETPQAQAKEPWQMTKAQFVASDEPTTIKGKDVLPTHDWMAEKLGGKKSLKDAYGAVESPEFRHAELVAQALREGKPVPAEVLVDYPDLAKPEAIEHAVTDDEFSKSVKLASEGEAVAFHGSKESGIKKFDSQQWFTSQPKVAQGYQRKSGGLYEVRVKIKTPWFPKEHPGESAPNVDDPIRNGVKYDGIILKDSDHPNLNKGEIQYLPFSSDQVSVVSEKPHPSLAQEPESKPAPGQPIPGQPAPGPATEGEVNPVEPVLHEFSDKEDAAQQAVLSSLQPANETDVKTVSDWAKKNTKWPKDFLMFRGKEGTPSEGMEAALTPISKLGQPYQVTFFARDPRGNLTPFGDVPVSTLEEGIRNAHQRNFEHVESKEAPVQAEPGTVAKPSGVARATPDSVPVGVKASDAPPQRLKLKGSPQVFTLVERLPQTATEKEMGEQPVRVKNERTGKVETMMESDFTPVSSTAKLKPKSDSKSDLDSKLRALGMDPSVFKSNAEKKMAIARAKAKATPMPSPTPDSPSEQEPKTKSAPGPATEGEKPAEPPAKAETSPSPEGKGPGITSMGGLAPSDPNEPVGKGLPAQSAGYGGDIYGVAQRVRDARAKAGQVAPVATGEGVSPEDAVEWGRELLRSGLDADKMQDEIEKTGKISFDAAAATRAHGEDVAQAARNIEGKFGTESPEYKIAQKALNDWDARTKGQGTIWHKIGMSMQGETDIDTGTFTGLQRAFKADGGNDFTPSQSVKAKKIAADNAKASAESEAAKKALYAKADEPPMSPKQKAIIEKAISFLDKAADDALSRIRARRAQGRAFSVGDPNDLDDYVIYGAAKIAKGTVEFGKWSAEMAIELGDYIKPYLKSIWDAADNIDKQLYKITDAQTAQAAKQAVRKSPAKPKSLDEIKKVLAGHVQGRNWSPEQVHALWQHVKTYLDKGMDDYGDIRNKVATDLGLPVSEVNRGLTQNKATKRLADDVWRKQHTERMMKQHAKRWLREQQFPALEKAARMVPRLFFGAKVFGHGTVALGTHAPMVAFQPNYWSSYFRDFGKMYHMVGSAAFHEMQMTDLMHRPNYTVARRAGLVNDPLSYEDFNSPDMNAFANEIFGQDKAPELVKKGESAVRKIAGAGNRGYSVLKLLRQDMFDQRWEALPETAKTPEVAQAIADGINHATGVTKKSGLPGLNTVFFAPRLEASRIAWLTVDPGKAGKTFATWSHATDAEKQFAINQVKEKATVIATMGTLLALNQGILTASGSKQEINFTDPMQSDWLKFKALGMDMSYGNPFITMVRLPVRLNSIRASDGGKLRNVIYPDESMSNEVFKYVRTQLSPFSSFLADIAFKGDYAERPLPEMPLSGSAIPLKKRFIAEGVEPYTWQEFLTETALPIPAEEAAREVFKGFQMDEDHQKTYLKALFTIGLMTGTGGRVSEDWTLNQ